MLSLCAKKFDQDLSALREPWRLLYNFGADPWTSSKRKVLSFTASVFERVKYRLMHKIGVVGWKRDDNEREKMHSVTAGESAKKVK